MGFIWRCHFFSGRDLFNKEKWRYKLATEKQKSGESILQYIQKLRLMSKDCDFKAITVGRLIKATSPTERLNADFKGPLPTNTRYSCIFWLCWRIFKIPISVPLQRLNIRHCQLVLDPVVPLVGLPSYIHSDRGDSFLPHEVSSFLNSLDIATSCTTSYNPRGTIQRSQ